MFYLIITKQGKAIGISNESVPIMSRDTSGVMLMHILAEDEVVAVVAVPNDAKGYILLVDKFGYGKRIEASQFFKQNPGGMGIKVSKNAILVSAIYVEE